MGSCSSVHRTSNSAVKFNKHSSSVSSAPPVLVLEEEKKPAAANGFHPPLIGGNTLFYDSHHAPSVKSFTSSGRFGSQEETFFDTQPYLDSDCDEFYSVNGDFTPSRGSTPVHASIGGTPRSQILSPHVQRALFEGKPSFYNGPSARSHGSTPVHRSVSATASEGNAANLNGQKPLSPAITGSPSPTGRRKKLAELFRESIRGDNGYDLVESQKHLQVTSPSNSTKATPYIFGPSSLAHSEERAPVEESNNGSEREKRPFKAAAQCCFPRLTSARSLKKMMTPPPAVAVDA